MTKMIKCKICGKRFCNKDIDNSLKISLGDIKDGNFQAGKIYYYHLECLNNFNYLKKEKIAERA